MVDIVIIGGGPAGYISALKAAKLNKEVVLIEKDQLGGTCLNRGCIPTKSLLHASHKFYELSKSEFFGISINEATVDYTKIDEYKNSCVTKLKIGIEGLLKNAKVRVIKGNGKILSNSEVEVNDEIISASNILIATGSKPRVLNIKGIDKEIVVTSNHLLNEFKEVDKIVIIGGGVIGVEFATIYANLKKDVTIIESCDLILSTLDKEISNNLAMQLRKAGVKIKLKATINEIVDNGIIVNDELIEADKILCAVGRTSNTENLFDNKLIDVNNGSIVVDDNFKTNLENVYAVGDCIKGIQLAHYASACGLYVIENIFKGSSSINLNNVPACVYTNMEIAEVGINEKAAKEKGIDYKVGKFSMLSNAKSVVSNSDRGFIKVISDSNNIVIGASLMCDRASDIVSIFTNAINNKSTIDSLTDTIYPHPSFSESIVEALEDTSKQALHVIYR